MNEFADYRFCSTWDGDGEIYSQENKVVWRFKMTGLKQHPAEVGIVRPAIFILHGADKKELVTISRERRLPLARFAVAESGSRCCTIWQRSIWFTKYEFGFDNKSNWKLYMPMFSVSGKVVSETGTVIRVQARTRREWYVRFDLGSESLPMIAALALWFAINCNALDEFYPCPSVVSLATGKVVDGQRQPSSDMDTHPRVPGDRRRECIVAGD